jgi:hypothetical protein
MRLLEADMKKWDIDPGVLRKAGKCDKALECMYGNSKCLHNVEHSIGEAVCYVKCDEKTCPYRVSHGFMGTVCSCPVRVEMYKRYGR